MIEEWEGEKERERGAKGEGGWAREESKKEQKIL
jgi:hypothetical protein